MVFFIFLFKLILTVFLFKITIQHLRSKNYKAVFKILLSITSIKLAFSLANYCTENAIGF
jgi:hypothetical protein